jgi:hypothetical protein
VTGKGLKTYLATQKKPSRIIGPVERHLLTRPADTSRRQDVMHPSEMVKNDWCIRAEFFKIKAARVGILPKEDRPGLRLQSIFDVGHAAHTKWQGYLAAMNVLYGKWRCPGGGEWVGADSTCPYCGEVGVYQELRLFSNELLISGSTDGWITDEPECTLEVKTIGTGTIRAYEPGLLYDNDNNLEKAFDSIRRPFLDHRRQGQMYMFLQHDMFEKGHLDRTPTEQAVFLYENKANQAYKEFTVKYNPAQIEDVLVLAETVVDALVADKAPRCNHGGCSKCKGL